MMVFSVFLVKKRPAARSFMQCEMFLADSNKYRLQLFLMVNLLTSEQANDGNHWILKLYWEVWHGEISYLTFKINTQTFKLFTPPGNNTDHQHITSLIH